MFLIFDTETTGLPKNYNAPLTDFDNWPRVIQIAWQLHGADGELIEAKNFIVKPAGFIIPRGAEKIHGITTERAEREGLGLIEVLDEFNKAVGQADIISGHNIEFDLNIMGAEFLRMEKETSLLKHKIIDTKDVSTDFCALPGGKGGKFKWPTLGELHFKLFGEDFSAAHNAMADVQATARSFFELIRIGVIDAKTLGLDQEFVDDFIAAHPTTIQGIGLDVESFHEEIEEDEAQQPEIISDEIFSEKASFTHLHVHTQYSVLDGLSDITKLFAKAKKDGMKALAITDHGNMFGVKTFFNAAKKSGLKPIIGCEVYVAQRGLERKDSAIDGGGWHLVLLAKNETGYKNLMKLVSYSWIDGFYYKPRVDKDLLKKYSEGLIALTACLEGELPDKIIHEGEEKAEEALLEYKEIFGEDLYLELVKHPTGDPEMDKKVFDDEVYVNTVLLKFAQKHNLKVVASNDVHFIEKDDAAAHDRLICIGTGKDVDDPKRLRYTQQEWFKTQQEMMDLFADIPQAITNTQEVVDKISDYPLDHDAIMPEFEIPVEFEDAMAYLKHISYEGAKSRYGEITEDLTERIEFELATIKKMGFPDYFLIVWDFLKEARKMGVSVGPGRGSAAGSVVAYALQITDIDPLKYNLLFERFLNPDRVSMPDIDIDFDDEGRDKVLEYVSNKYGKMRVAHLITFGTMAAKMALRDVARVQKLPLSEADRLAKMVPERPGVSLTETLKEVPEFSNELTDGRKEVQEVIKNALTLEGSIRNTGTHACGVIIGRDDLYNYVPLSIAKDSMLGIATQYDGKNIESIGLLKMDFLGLKTLSILKDTIINIKRSKGIDLDIEKIPFDDQETYELFSRGDTTALFQFESDGMQKHLQALKPTRFEDLIAMNALYRPGPMKYIPNFIDRKHGKEEIVYDLPIMEEILEETYGITVYQEQVMLLARKMGGLTGGQSDSLRKAMGKKLLAEMDKLRVIFMDGCKQNGLPEDKVKKVWNDWIEFTKYAFNKSHATCYSYLAYQTAYLKAHFPAEFMAANLSHNLNDIKKITQLISESSRMGIEVTRPDVNESSLNFTVNKQGVIRFGMAAIKGVGEAAVEQIIEEREKNGPYKNIFDFAKRVNLRSVNKRSFQALAMAGAFDGFEGTHRAQYFYKENDGDAEFLEYIIKHGANYQERQNSQQASLFGDMADSFELVDPKMPDCEPWTMATQLHNEKEVTGFYISGHPLDKFKKTIERFCTMEAANLKNESANLVGETVSIAGMVVEANQKTSKNGSNYGQFVVEDYSGNVSLMLFSEPYLKWKHMLVPGNNVFIQIKIEERYNQPGVINLNVSDIMLLNETMNRLTKKINLFVNADKTNDEQVAALVSKVNENKGECPLIMSIKDPENGKYLSLKSSKNVDPSAFLKAIESLPGVSYLIN